MVCFVGFLALGEYFLGRPLPPDADLVAIVQSRDLEKAKGVFEKFGKRDGTDTEAWLLLKGFVYVRSGRPKGALLCFSRIPPDCDFRESLLLLTGETLYLDQQLAPALNCFQQVIAANPRQVDACRWLAAIHYDLGNMEMALQYLGPVISASHALSSQAATSSLC